MVLALTGAGFYFGMSRQLQFSGPPSTELPGLG
jgi:hypothetical protein